MRIGICQLENIQNVYSLQKIELYHKLNGDTIKYIKPDESRNLKKIYIHSFFKFTPKPANRKNFITGGTGYDIQKTLPPEIDAMRPLENIGYTTRGCPKDCSFCIVRKKEGRFRRTGDIFEFWDRKSKNITILDNNILYDFEHFKKIFQQIQAEKLQAKIEQGFDIDFLDSKRIEIIKKTNIKQINFAWDDISKEKIVLNKIKLLNEHKIKRYSFFILCGYNSTPEQDLYRILRLRQMNIAVYVMRYTVKPYLKVLQWYANNRKRFFAMDLKTALLNYKVEENLIYFFEKKILSFKEWKNNQKENNNNNQLLLF